MSLPCGAAHSCHSMSMTKLSRHNACLSVFAAAAPFCLSLPGLRVCLNSCLYMCLCQLSILLHFAVCHADNCAHAMSVVDLLCAHAFVHSALHLALQLGMECAELQHAPRLDGADKRPAHT